MNDIELRRKYSELGFTYWVKDRGRNIRYNISKFTTGACWSTLTKFSREAISEIDHCVELFQKFTNNAPGYEK